MLLPCPRDLPREIDRTALFVIRPVITLALLATVEDELAGVLGLAAGLAAEAEDLWVLGEVRHVLLAAGPVAGVLVMVLVLLASPGHLAKTRNATLGRLSCFSCRVDDSASVAGGLARRCRVQEGGCARSAPCQGDALFDRHAFPSSFPRDPVYAVASLSLDAVPACSSSVSLLYACEVVTPLSPFLFVFCLLSKGFPLWVFGASVPDFRRESSRGVTRGGRTGV